MLDTSCEYSIWHGKGERKCPRLLLILGFLRESYTPARAFASLSRAGTTHRFSKASSTVGVDGMASRRLGS